MKNQILNLLSRLRINKIASLLVLLIINSIGYAQNMPYGVKCLIDAYPELQMGYDGRLIKFPDGTSIVYDDAKDKSFEEKLDNSDIEDMFSLSYDTLGYPDYLADAGRSRCEALFKRMYGGSALEVQKHLIKVDWFGQNIQVTKVNNVDIQLAKVAKELSLYPELRKYLTPASTFYWRKVRGANRQSAHSYGIAVDINTKYSDYWLWANNKAKETDKISYKNRIPVEIVRIFEKYGFIWGGRWYHFDTMHFEYRPEILKTLQIPNRD